MHEKYTYEELEKRVQELEQAEHNRKRTEAVLEDRINHYRLLFNTARDMFFLHHWDSKGHQNPFLEVNNIACQTLEYSKTEFKKLSPVGIHDKGDPKNLPDQNRTKNLDEQQSLLHEKILISKSGKKIPVEINTHLFKRNGQILAFSIARDISERKQAEKKLEESKEKYRFLVEQSLQGLIIAQDNPLRLSFVSKPMETHCRLWV